MPVVFASIALGCLIVMAACSVVFPVIFIVCFNRFRKEMLQQLGQNQKEVEHEI